ncbi:MAG: hypothetical protein HGA67_00980 [Candidatus Yonathbacteria bacterium]|nr:hypothetical protein [Candidatus Yonathbacteria bacterium]
MSYTPDNIKKFSWRNIALLCVVGLGVCALSTIDDTRAYLSDVERSSGVFEAGELTFGLTAGLANSLRAGVALLGTTDTPISDWETQGDGTLTRTVTIADRGTSMPFLYELSAHINDGNACTHIKDFEIKFNGVSVHSGLYDMQYTPTSPFEGFGEWTFTITLDQDAVPGDTCSFDLIYNGWQKGMPAYGVGGYTDTQTISNFFVVPGVEVKTEVKTTDNVVSEAASVDAEQGAEASFVAAS